MKPWKKLLGIFMSSAVLITGGILPQKNAAIAEGVVDYGINNPRIENGVATWDKIKFGSYYQDAEIQPAEPIKWRVLSVNEDDAFLLADKSLDCKQYNEIYGDYGDVTWETCTLRKWLNEDFYNEAFNNAEKEAIRDTIVVNGDNPSLGTEGGNDTKDKVYLLSTAEASDVAYGFEEVFNECSKTREAKNTNYAQINHEYYTDTGVCNNYWWLRTPGYGSSWASYVSNAGYGNIYGDFVQGSKSGVRPALHINLSSSSWSKAGEVSSAGQDDDTPTALPKPTKEPITAASSEPTKEPMLTNKPISSTEPTQTHAPTATVQPAPPAVATQNPAPTAQPALKQLKLLSVKCTKNTKKITSKV